jgi:hypothetical protein
MNRTLLALVLVGIASTGISPGFAADASFDPGNVQYGYSDGYWTRTHEWHDWEKPSDIRAYRATPNAEYYIYKHDRDADMGWRNH